MGHPESQLRSHSNIASTHGAGSDFKRREPTLHRDRSNKDINLIMEATEDFERTIPVGVSPQNSKSVVFKPSGGNTLEEKIEDTAEAVSKSKS